MRYRIPKHGIIRSENAAKPVAQKNKFLLELISELTPVENTVDYGTGKLRYLTEILHTTNQLTVVDSLVQLERGQVLHGKTCSIRDFAETRNTIRALNTKEFIELSDEFDRAFLLNVLQIIPIPNIRIEVLRRIRRKLRKNGEIFSCVQYRNSDFTRMAAMHNARQFRDGIIIDHLRGTSFYGFISPDQLQALFELAGFAVEKRHLHEGTCYIRARPV